MVKFFAYASFLVLLIFSFPFSVVISKNAEDTLMRNYENYALLLGENLNHQVYHGFVVPITENFGSIRLRDPYQYNIMDRIVRNTIHSFKIDLVNIHAIGQGVIAYSTDRTLLGKKAAATAGYTRAIKGEHSSRLVSGEDNLWGIGEKIRGEKKLRTYIPFRWQDPLTGAQGEVGGVFELIQDLTQEYRSITRFQFLVFALSILIMGLIFIALLMIVRKAEGIIKERAREQMELESQLNHAERLAALGQMVAGVSHEIRNPLGIIRSTAELLGGTPDSSETQTNLSKVIIEESSRLDNIVTEFLDFARPLTPNFQECQLEEIIHKNILFLQPELEKEDISVNNSLDGKKYKLNADPQMLYRAFLNIFINSIQSGINGGTLTVNISDARGHYIVSIEDTGCGISEENQSKIFNPFFSSKDKGSGLGLPIVRNIIEGHRGSIWIESKEGLGTKVFVKLPRG